VSAIDLTFDHVSKRYRVRQPGATVPGRRSLGQALGRLRRRRTEQFWAVRDVSFEVERSEALGVIGANGAGKSTVLKLLSSITAPTSGEIRIDGRLSALIEVGSGFHPELTGRENVYLSGSILGMRRREITAKLDDIVEFAGVRPFIDTPVKRFSSGMFVRLGFSIAAHLDPDILLLDEVLAVGDAAFQAKCLERIGELKRRGKTIVFVSHDLGAVARLCDRVLLMRSGRIHATGAPRAVIAEYQRLATEFTPSPPPGARPVAAKAAEVRGCAFGDGPGREASTARTGQPLVARLGYIARERIPDAVFEIFFYTADGALRCQLTTEAGDAPLTLVPGSGTVEFRCPALGLQPGMYGIDATIKHRHAPPGDDIDWQYRCAMLRVDPGRAVRGDFYVPHEWRLVDGGGMDDAHA
jgi:homopolymeric O-antigen transport system ATP-binding protein